MINAAYPEASGETFKATAFSIHHPLIDSIPRAEQDAADGQDDGISSYHLKQLHMYHRRGRRLGVQEIEIVDDFYRNVIDIIGQKVLQP